MTPSPASPLAASSPRWVVVLLSCAILVLAIGLLMYLVRPKHAAPALAEVSRTDLVLRDGLLYRAGEQSPFTGIATDTYAGGEPKSRSQISNGVPESVSVGYHTNGQIQVEEYFRAGVSHGRRTKWYASGTKQSEASIVAGKLHGLYADAAGETRGTTVLGGRSVRAGDRVGPAGPSALTLACTAHTRWPERRSLTGLTGSKRSKPVTNRRSILSAVRAECK